MAIKLRLHGLSEAVGSLPKIPENMSRVVIARMSQIVYNGMQEGAQRHTRSGNKATSGALLRSVYNRKIENGREVGHDPQIAPHAIYIVGGTRPHWIKARNKKALRYEKDGMWWFWFGPKADPNERRSIVAWVRKVAGKGAYVMFKWPWHPGYVGDGYMIHSVTNAVREFARIVDEATKDAA